MEEVRQTTVNEAWEKVWEFREKWGHVWLTPTPEECALYAFTEVGEAIDAMMRMNRSADLRAREDRNTDVLAELGDAAIMALSAIRTYPGLTTDITDSSGIQKVAQSVGLLVGSGGSQYFDGRAIYLTMDIEDLISTYAQRTLLDVVRERLDYREAVIKDRIT